MLGTDRTATPLELDEIYESLDRAERRARPGRCQQGRRARPDPAARLDRSQLRRPGREFHQTIRTSASSPARWTTTRKSCSAPSRRSSGSSNTLAKNDTTVRRFNDSLAGGRRPARGRAGGPRGGAAQPRHRAGRRSQGFVKENRDGADAQHQGPQPGLQVLVKQRDAIDEILEVAPTALNNLFLAYNPPTGHARHPHQHRRERQPARPPTRRCCCAASSSQAGRPATSCCDVIADCLDRRRRARSSAFAARLDRAAVVEPSTRRSADSWR